MKPLEVIARKMTPKDVRDAIRDKGMTDHISAKLIVSKEEPKIEMGAGSDLGNGLKPNLIKTQSIENTDSVLSPKQPVPVKKQRKIVSE